MTTAKLTTANLGFPRMGLHRELKFALESFWSGKTGEDDLLAVARDLRRRHWLLQQQAGIGIIPSSDLSLYDQVLDAMVLLGATPARYGEAQIDGARASLRQYFDMARNSAEQPALEMTKWFDTNYHYLVPEWSAGLHFQANPTGVVEAFEAARSLGIATRPVLIGPITLLLLGKSVDGIEPLSLLPKLLTAYETVLRALVEAGATQVQLDEPMLVTDLAPEWQQVYDTAYAVLAMQPLQITVATYFGALGDNLEIAATLPVSGLHIDLVRAPQQLDAVLAALPPEKTLSLGVVDGRNIWRTEYAAVKPLIDRAVGVLGPQRVVVAPSCSLLHVPVDKTGEDKLPEGLFERLSFAVQKLGEVRHLATADTLAFAANAAHFEEQRRAARPSQVREKLATLNETDFSRPQTYAERAPLQRAALHLPLLPTTTIGSFPQTQEVRSRRAAWRKGQIDDATYERFLEEATAECIRRQEELGLDVLVHGEFERNDMVEYFGEQLDGFAFTKNGWVQSYGSRCVKPPVIYADVHRPEPMTVRWSKFAQSLTSKPMKGMLTGPVTILQWSFVRNDIPESETTFQIALALREEIEDLERAGIGVIQVDEPALREGLPLRKSEYAAYLEWAVKAFRLATSSVKPETQVHTHMCYAEFETILPAIAALDADVISMESARSKMALLRDFKAQGYPNEIGPGVWDIHATRVPSQDEIHSLLDMALVSLKADQLWVNPDCGLKTRQWPETEASLQNMVAAAKAVREELATE
ncbi:5-methyltetrahydropteroyltriglutamate--homocysteine S-methyltransferase [Terriglobus albidus]|uniref:5-methyltetrahydropteroyltriglutamate--homocysteine methyltransferase n=1 Tax=Terriglobus albidus TaxID=1592106 RepID=A0A5B9EKP2_9BACT|nr:5-methyltetrahydropteroyltriglutamate--homocysteine S-methyltransferase [Terriglobus albidus]QEE30987.1 5-methyltetrahydropteroyltriglutamate--homocysteine S-methyltransferase [Terriglobus albidus]